MKKLAIAIAALALSAASHAQSWTGNDLLTRLQSDEHGSRMAALGYVRGIADALQGEIFCPPDGVTYGQAYDVVANWLTVNAAQRHRGAGPLTIVALASTWPCKQQRQQKGGA